MRIQPFLFVTVFAAALAPSRAAAQHEAHQATTSPSAEMARCAQSQPAVQNIITAATARLESARQSNTPADMRAAIENFETALRDIRTLLAPCATAPAAPHAEHAMPSTPAAPAADPHAGHHMPAAQSAVAGKPQTDKPRDPVNGLIVEPATAPKTAYQGQTYYFSSEESRKEFLANPAKFAKRPKR
jgi:YHS domain-containing protein